MTRRILGILAIILALAMALPASAALTVVQQWAPTSQGVWPAAKGVSSGTGSGFGGINIGGGYGYH